MHQVTSIPLSILAGGEGRRLGGVDKCLLKVKGKTILQHLLDSFAPVTHPVFLNANGNPARFEGYDITIIQDQSATPVGPLGGIIASLNHLIQSGGQDQWLMTISGDSPFLSGSLVDRLIDAISDNNEVIYCRCAGRDHFVIALWSVGIINKLQDFVNDDGRSVGQFIKTCRYKIVDFPDDWGPYFFNINTDKEWREANRNCDA